MLNVNGLPQNTPINVRKVNFRADNSSRKYTPAMTAEQQMADYQKERKSQKTRQNINLASTILITAGIVGSLVLSFFMVKGSPGDNRRLNAIKSALKKIDNPNIKREIEEELARPSYERSLYRAEDLVKLDELSKVTENRKKADIAETAKKMNADIIGMDRPKEEVIKFLEAYNYDISEGVIGDNTMVLHFTGAPGTGKTSLAKSISDATGSYFLKISLQNVKSPEEITGFLRTWAGATPGVIAKAQLEGNTKKICIVLDEIDKADPKILNVLLPFLDNQKIVKDAYYNTNIDLSQCMFILTSNNSRVLPEALRNRLQTIYVERYSDKNKADIAKLHLTKLLKESKLEKNVTVRDEIYDTIAKLATDDGGRNTTMMVQNLIKELKCMRQNGEKHIEINNELIKKLDLSKYLKDA